MLRPWVGKRWVSRGSATFVAGLLISLQPYATRDALADEPKKTDVDLGDVFGFTTPTDTLGRGERELAHETVGRFGKSGGTYRVLDNKTQIGFGVAEGFSITPGLLSTWADISPSMGAADYSGFTVDGIALEFKALLLDRNRHGVGLAIIAEPTIGWHDGETGDSAHSRGIELRVASDWAILPQRLFAGVNIVYGLESSSQGGLTEKASQLTGSGGLSYRVSDSFFLGGEVRYVRAYDGLGLGSFLGDALFIGPALLIKPTDKITVTLTWQPQVWGHEVGSSGNLDLANFERHETKLKIAVPF